VSPQPRRARAGPLADRLVLHHFLLSELGATSFEDLAAHLRDPELEEVDADGVSRFHHALVAHRSQTAKVDPATLLRYDDAIQRHTRAISAPRDEPVRWRYFQYLMLLVTERYLDRLLSDPEALRVDLSDFVRRFNEERPATDRIDEYQLADLRKLAFWSATGSGKTLVMHANLHQYRTHLEHHGQKAAINRVLLLTPNEGLSRQHLAELRHSGIEADLFAKDAGSLFAGQTVEVIDIHKLREESGEKTVAVDAFERNNLVLVDEGHRGAGGETWMDIRDRLSEEGFSFEYSATFGQAFAREPQLAGQYAKWIGFDYAYRRFHADGYGKDYSILNLPQAEDDAARREYLTAALLSFYQQRRLFDDRRAALQPYLIERPLWVFVGSNVNANVVRSEGGRAVSDVLDILLTFARFLSQPEEMAETFERLLTSGGGLRDAADQDIFAGAFPYLEELALDGTDAYGDLLRRVFNASATGPLRVVLRRGVDGELALQVGDNEPFGVVNVGDAPRLHKLCAEREELFTDETLADRPLFDEIDDKQSPVSVLIGAKRFIEGWSSWRVSSLGLMRVGASEGPQIIQLFGRGVRLKGRELSLRRSSRLEPPPSDGLPAHIKLLETLTVFGLRANYMTEFENQLALEGAPTGPRPTVTVPTERLSDWPNGLKVPRLPQGLDFRHGGPILALSAPANGKPTPITVDWYARVQAIMSAGAVQAEEASAYEGRLTRRHAALIDTERLFHDLVEFKRLRGWHNMAITRSAVAALLDRDDWYTLRIPAERLRFDHAGRISEWQEIALALLKSWCERVYKFGRGRWEEERMRLEELRTDDPNLIEDHEVMVKVDDEELVRALIELRERVAAGEMNAGQAGKLEAFGFDRHLYSPLLYLSDSDEVVVKPVALNAGEQRFVKDLREFAAVERDRFLADRELYLLRNMSRGRGIGFFQAGNFYPDFLVWLVEGRRQRILFVDPKGIVHLGSLDHPKIRFRKTIKNLEERLGDPSVSLSSFILSVTRFSDVSWAAPKNIHDFEAEHVLFPFDYAGTYIKDMFERALADPQ
jgi:Type III restriction enzyme, res subunit